MTAFHTTLVAISLSKGQYAVHSQTYGALDADKLEKDGLLNDVSENSGYIDEAAILQKADVPKYFLPKSSQFHDRTVEWYNSLPSEVFFVLMHRAEFESGFGD